MMLKMTSAAKVAVLTVAFVCLAAWIISLSGENNPSSSGKTPDATNESQDISIESAKSVGNVPIEATPPGGLKEAGKDLDETQAEFQTEYSKFRADSSLENVQLMRQDINSFLDDAADLQERARTAYKVCIANSTDSTVFGNCLGPQLALRSGISHFGIESTLGKLPNVSRTELIQDDAGFIQDVSRQMSRSRSTLRSIADNPNLADEYGVSVTTVEPLIDEAQRLQNRAMSLGDDDGVRKWILLNHAGLILDDFNLRTLRYSMMLDSGKPLLP